MKTGHLVFHYKTGTYTPVISDGRRIYLVGYSSINALEPITPQALARARAKAKARRARLKARSARRSAARHRRAHPVRGSAKEPARGGRSGSGSG